MSDYTPGPWKVREKPVSSGCKAKVECLAGYVVAEAFSSPSCSIPYKELWKEAEANAQLIAAAPEMLGILQYIEGRIQSGDTKSIAQIRAVISKATGETA